VLLSADHGPCDAVSNVEMSNGCPKAVPATITPMRTQ
jgi:hypothetical protein